MDKFTVAQICKYFLLTISN